MAALTTAPATVLVTGARGFVGRWLTAELEHAGWRPLPLESGVDIRDGQQVRDIVARLRPRAIVHLAAIAFSGDANDDPHRAYSTAVVGTASVLEAARQLDPAPAVLVTSSSEVYGEPQPWELPLTEDTPLRARGTYGVSKLAQESVALAYSVRYGIPVIVTRSFNHIGPGQRPEFVVPAIAQRVAVARRDGLDHIVVGNIDVRRDLTDVRDVVRAYRMLLEHALESPADLPLVVNVCSSRVIAIRDVIASLLRFAGARLRLEVDSSLVRSRDAPEMRGDYARLASMTGWRPEIDLETTLADVWSAAVASVTPTSGQ